MRPAQEIERAVGIEYYVSDGDGIGGHLRESPADFRVEEREAFDTQPADADSGAYQHLVLRATLHNWDTNDFASALSDRLGISRERVSWAGTKDKHAVTTQLFSVKRPEGNDLPTFDGVDIDAGAGQAVPCFRAGGVAHGLRREQSVDVRRLVFEQLHPGRPHRRREDLPIEEAFEVTQAGVRRGPALDQALGQRRQTAPVTHSLDLASVGHRSSALRGSAG